MTDPGIQRGLGGFKAPDMYPSRQEPDLRLTQKWIRIMKAPQYQEPLAFFLKR